ncbi:MAG: hypothetical protein IKY12_04490, partial [Clostridia bacterium]|nr:hypothetical protein [Clostridia bacterium]
DDADQDKVVIQNVYFSTVDSEKGLMGNLFDKAGLPEHLTYDTIFVDTTLSRAINGPNIVQLGDNTSFTIKNSLFRNYNILNAAFLGNGNNSVTEGVDRKVIIDNNIFYNSSFRSKKQNIISYHPKLLSEVQITNNNVIVPADSKYLSAGVYLAGVDDMQNVGTTPKPLKVVITGNYVDYAQGVVLFDGFAGKNTASDSVIENNYLRLKASATGLPIIYAGVPNVTSSNWLITADGTNHSGIIQPMTFDGDTFDKTETVTVTFVVDTINLLDHIGSPEAVTVSGSDYNGNVFEGYSDAELTTAVDLTAVPATESTTVYVKVSSPDGKTKTSDVYTINIVVDITHNWVYEYDDNNHWQKCIGGTCNCGVTTEVTPHEFDDDADTSCDCGYTRTVTLFSEAFVGDSYINKDKAVLLSNETALVNAKDGDGVKLSWRGTDYVFIKGTNAFTSLSAIQAKNLDNPHILVKNNTEGTNFYLNVPAKVFTQNYDVNPVKVGTANDGSDWAFNSTEWNSDYEVSYD